MRRSKGSARGVTRSGPPSTEARPPILLWSLDAEAIGASEPGEFPLATALLPPPALASFSSLSICSSASLRMATDVGDLHNIRSLECGREAFELGEQGTEGEGEDDDASGWGDGEGNRTRPSKAPARPEAKPVVFDLLSVIPTPRTELQAPNPVYESKAGFLPPSGLRGPPCRSGWVLPPDAKGPGLPCSAPPAIDSSESSLLD